MEILWEIKDICELTDMNGSVTIDVEFFKCPEWKEWQKYSKNINTYGRIQVIIPVSEICNI